MPSASANNRRSHNDILKPKFPTKFSILINIFISEKSIDYKENSK